MICDGRVSSMSVTVASDAGLCLHVGKRGFFNDVIWQINAINIINPLLPIAHKSAQIDKISILKLEGIIRKMSYERRDYESVDEKSLSKAMSRKTTKKRIQALKG